MVSIYEIKNGFLGAVDEVADRAPAPAGWTFTVPPKMARGKAAKWAGDGWVLVPASEADAAMEAAQAAARARQLEVALSGVDAERDARIARGKPHTFPDGTTGTVQLRHERDSVNINAVATAGTALVAAGSTDTVSFRDAEDVTHTLTGVEAVQFGLAVMQWVSAHYAAAWAHKDAIKAMQAAGEDITGYDLSQGWPEGAP
ncbi:MAG: hypothetical protein ACLGG8_03920 [Gammaproteobacteria bacterium]